MHSFRSTSLRPVGAFLGSWKVIRMMAPMAEKNKEAKLRIILGRRKKYPTM
jgi:hypothetical protein